ncbi:peptidoglycan DD-metalloendopeptidase family protein [Chitinasiproducens palmae]|uniref:peptidoglycan DD-metalloendopeptidase family protein n=1 Tax=Chitinasiproducens palmae TaxID=1770053 RepID=UPI001F34B14C|nr:peptidoglycan DD-metalloendopeptidase family protein [Chitinasiproducens palmae]
MSDIRRIRRACAPRLHALVLASVIALCACAGGAAPEGFYRVERGDTLNKIAQANRRSVAELVRWNRLANPDRIEVGDLLRVVPPDGSAASSATAIGTTGAASSAPTRRRAATPATPRVPRTTASVPAGQTIDLRWPIAGAVIRGFDGGASKGIDIAGDAGQPVAAAADGEVVYAGQLRGYGTLLIIKHDANFLTSYAHLQSVAVKEKQRVSAGQTIATVGSSEAPSPQLHFELRYGGRPVDPTRYLPSR